MEINKIKESSNVIKKALQDNIIRRPVEGTAEFFMNKSKESVIVANRLLELKKEEDLPSNLWVVNSSYYSMFFAATALLAKHNKRISTNIGIHRLTFHALVHYFLKEDNKIEKHFLESYKDAIEDAEELLQFSNSKANDMITFLDFEMEKRKNFTYNLGKKAETKKAKTSLLRAKEFVRVVEDMIQK